jgi:hypothetical protein
MAALVLLLLLAAPALTEPLPLTLRRAVTRQPQPQAQPQAQVHAQTQEPLPLQGLLAPRVWSLPLGALRPRGWLDQQLRIERDGLAGHLQLFYEDIGACVRVHVCDDAVLALVAGCLRALRAAAQRAALLLRKRPQAARGAAAQSMRLPDTFAAPL